MWRALYFKHMLNSGQSHVILFISSAWIFINSYTIYFCVDALVVFNNWIIISEMLTLCLFGCYMTHWFIIYYIVLYYIVLYCFNEYNVWIDFIVFCRNIMLHIYDLNDKPKKNRIMILRKDRVKNDKMQL